MTDTDRPDTIVLVHGLWMTPRSWEDWAAYFRGKGFTVLTPAYPGFEIEVEELRENPDIIANLTVPDTLDHLQAAIETVEGAPPIIMGHSFGGTLTQLHYAFTNTLSAEDSRAAWDRYAIGAPGNWVWAYGLIANFKPGKQETWVDYDADRAPLLFIGGEKDHIMPPSVNKSNAKHYKKSPAVTEYYEFEGRDHWTCGAPGWEAVADKALDWALEHATPARESSSAGS